MLGLNYIKFDAMNYVILYKNGRVAKQGKGLSFFYYAPQSSIVSIPLESHDFQFVFKETTQDFQEVTIQGQVTYKITDPRQLAEQLDFTVNKKKQYLKEDPEKIEQRIINEAQAASAAILQRLTLKDSLRRFDQIEQFIIERVQSAESIQLLGVELQRVNILGVTPQPEMSRALEAQTRESLQKQADRAIYERRNFAVEQERMIKESELNTEIAVEEKQNKSLRKRWKHKW